MRLAYTRRFNVQSLSPAPLALLLFALLLSRFIADCYDLLLLQSVALLLVEALVRLWLRSQLRLRLRLRLCAPACVLRWLCVWLCVLAYTLARDIRTLARLERH